LKPTLIIVNAAAVKKIAATLSLSLVFACAAFAVNNNAVNNNEDQRVRQAGQALSEILNAANGIPQNLLDRASCILIFPSVEKGTFGVGGRYGRGVLVCRSGLHQTDSWGSPALYALEGRGVKFPGGRNVDFVLLVMNPEAARSLLSGRVKLGWQISTAAGPATSTLEKVSAPGDAEILCYSRDRGVFTGISLAGSTLRSDANADQKLYGKKKLTAKGIILDRAVGVPACAGQLVSILNSKSPSSPS
jgi:lipid-binding SYLF domain-containing protein